METVNTMTYAASGVASGVGYVASIIIGLVFAYICNRIAIRKGRGPVLWAILGFLFTLITLIVILVMPRKNRAY